MRRGGETKEQRMQLVLQASRAVAYDLAKVASYVKKDLPEIGRLLDIDECGHVTRGFNEVSIRIAEGYCSKLAEDNNKGPGNRELGEPPRMSLDNIPHLAICTLSNT